MKGLRRVLVAATVVTALAGALTPATAVPPGGSIAAAVTGSVNANAGTCADGRAKATFTDVTIIGAFTRATQVFVGTVNVQNVNVCLDPIVGNNQLLANGTLQPGTAPTYTSATGVGTVSGTLTGMTFTNAGAVAVAMVDTNFSIGGGPNTGNVNAVAVVAIAPAQTVACEANIAALCGNPNVRDIVAATIVA